MKKTLFAISIAALVLSAEVIMAQETETEKAFSAGIVNGKAISLPAPKYPEFAEGKNIQGAATIEVIIDKAGIVESAKALSGRPVLRKAATVAALQAKFKPTLLQNKPVKVKGIIVYNFGNEPREPLLGVAVESSPGVINGLATSLPIPEYPAAAKAVCAEGPVNVKVELSRQGEVLSAEAVSGHPLLRATSVKAANKAKFGFEPAQEAKTSGILIYKFTSDSECNSGPH